MEEKKFKRGMVFGVFDGLHEGHKFFLSEAAKRCQKLIVVVTHDDVVQELKHHPAKDSCEARIHAIRQWKNHYVCMCGDAVLGQWSVFKATKPDIVFLGYDQKALEKELIKMNQKYKFLPPYKPKQFKTSLLQ